MDILSELRHLKKGKELSYFDFLNNLQKGNHTVHFFFEGKNDGGFYGSMLRKLIPDNFNIKSYVCGTKSEVYKTREKIRKRDYKNDTILFFVDKDIDNYIPVVWEQHLDIHTTEYYSIENYLINSSIFSHACYDIFKMNEGDQQIEALKVKFDSSSKIASKILTQVMSWILACRRLGLNPMFSNIKMSDIFIINDDTLNVEIKLKDSELYDYLSVASKVGFTFIEFSEIQTIELYLSTEHEHNYIRGKFYLSFLIDFINKSKLILEKANNTKIKLHLNINESTVIDLLAPRLKTPKSITTFMSMNFDIGAYNVA